MRYLHINAYGHVDKLSVKDNFNTLIESTHHLIWAASRKTRALQYKLQDTEPRTVWRLLLANLEPTPYGFVLENIDSQTPTLKLIPLEQVHSQTYKRLQPTGSIISMEMPPDQKDE